MRNVIGIIVARVLTWCNKDATLNVGETFNSIRINVLTDLLIQNGFISQNRYECEVSDKVCELILRRKIVDGGKQG